MELDNPQSIRKKIMDFLSRREYSSKELYRKLTRKVNSLKILEEEIGKLKKEGLINDERFAEQYTYSLFHRGLGPVRIKRDLLDKGIKDVVISNILDSKDWVTSAKELLKKKARNEFPLETKQVIKLKNFLIYRGFDYHEIEKAFLLFEQDENL